jgi:iron complex outermembrane recepter protein
MTQCRLRPSGLCIDPVRQCFVRKSLPLFATTSTYDPGAAQTAPPSLDTQANPSTLPTITITASARAYDSATATKTETPIIETPQSISVVPSDQLET